MTTNRKTLSLRPSAPEPADAESIVRRGMAHLRCVRGVYNRGQVILAPHILYTRHGALYLDAVVITRDGARPKETKLASFKLEGVRDIAATLEPFSPLGAFDPAEPRYGEEVVARVEGW